ncbi:hypothetical protein PpBr36_09076 [Pyricularia pennisetigena]|uniref:hypothetical protein n=1 Tax=Pyricularia pennisetigena TaxID=1578925 RepID=UPI0011500D89|nr:hypothetical protein PpBr36_09076 [Pyricularia pennisetigena]TLS24886.1 hypothetical protein PpBr36_09076 [Pyricularia pennisetigena]
MAGSKANKKFQAGRRKAQQTSHSPPSSSPSTSPVGPPRMDKQVQLLHRFYEPMNLLFALGQTRGEHIKSEDDGSARFKRRRFLNDLAYIYDLAKGGPATTAIAVEEQANEYIFWFALNATGEASTNVRLFRESSLRTIRQSLSREPGATRELLTRRLTADCVGAARSRIKEEVRLLMSNINSCISKLQVDAGKATGR